MQEHWLSVEESAAHLGVSRDTIYKWLVRKLAPAQKVSSPWKFLPSGGGTWVRLGQPAPKKVAR